MKKILICIIFCLVIPFSVFAVDTLDTAKTLFLRDDTDGAIRECQKLIPNTDNKESISQAYYIMGMSLLKQLKPTEARLNFEILVNEFKDTKFVSFAACGIADSYFQEGNFQQACLEYEKILSDYPQIPFKSSLQFKRARCFVKLGRLREAKDLFKRIKNEYPLSFEADSAKEILNENLFYFTIQAGAFVERDRAERFCEKLKEKGFDTFISQITKGKKTYYRVRVGKFNSQEETNAIAEKLKKEGYSVKVYP